jgi:hypothetical protein
MPKMVAHQHMEEWQPWQAMCRNGGGGVQMHYLDKLTLHLILTVCAGPSKELMGAQSPELAVVMMFMYPVVATVFTITSLSVGKIQGDKISSLVNPGFNGTQLCSVMPTLALSKCACGLKVTERKGELPHFQFNW